LKDRERVPAERQVPVASESIDPTVLVNHDGELVDVLALLSEAGVGVIDRRGPPTGQDARTSWELVIATPKRIVKLAEMDAKHRAARVAIVDGASRTLRSMLQRMAIDFVVRRPVHPTALRLLLLRSLYRGPEKRSGGRVSVGAPVRVRCGFRSRPAVLADLSFRGCRLLSSHGADQDSKVTVRLPAELSGRRALSLKGRVKRCQPASGEAEGMFDIGVILEGLGASARSGVRAILETHAKGPAVLNNGRAPGGEPVRKVADSEVVGAPERRTSSRRPYDRRVTALADDATRVLLGRDISLGGMRVDPTAEIEQGDRFRLAIHVRARKEPLVVTARATRDDGDDGLVLEFEELTAESTEYLKKMINFIPILAARGDGDGVGVIVSEILERETEMGC
jgi:hypothetical protein